ncbi:DUF4271 domain-containing protein [Daejeonella sp. H1SJ63]|jgi:hypothetical protein|uniref:DUF4271 domain-containing protein n=1 Tax=Daejeonella sp. H1SJ63 TaxID=3034145 RepID=UPI0023EDE980|nr:DUF4271 domain-containing protein [Daejeonella sp. H1SJ63]
MIERVLGVILILFLINPQAFGQVDSSLTDAGKPGFKQAYSYTDSASFVRWKAYKDSVQAVRDSLSTAWIKAPDPQRPNRFLDSLINLYKVEKLDFVSWAAKFKKKDTRYDEGKPRPYRETWVMIVILLLVLFFALIRYFFPAELSTIVHAFYSNQTLSRINKEDTLFSSWPFVFLYLLFGLVIGLYLYLSGKYLELSYSNEGFELFIFLSATVIGLFTAKIIVLRVLGFFFDVNRMVREYVSVLYLSYFNAAILFLPVVLAFSLTSYRFAGIYSYIGIAGLIIIFIIQFLRAGANILSNYKFPKVYLIIYLCALEFCPLIILFKALGY